MNPYGNIVEVVIQENKYVTELREQFGRINKAIERGETVTLLLTENTRSISLTIDRDQVVKSESPVKPPSTDNNSLIAMITHTYSFDVGEIDRQVKPHDIAAMQPPTPVVTYNGKTWIVAQDCDYTTKKGIAISVHSGFETDLASVPRICWFFIAPFELSLAAPIFHDLIYRSGGKVALPGGKVAPADKIFTRQEADDIFLELMEAADVRPAVKRKAAHFIVEYFAGWAWRKTAA